MNKLKYIAVIAFLSGFGSQNSFAQLKEEKLVLDRKREPEVKRIEKKKTSVQQEKNYPPEAKANEVVKYDVTDVPPVSDFKTSEIQAEDISPKFDFEKQNNYFQIGYGNYGKFLADANISGKVNDNVEVGADVHYLSTSGLKKEYDWSSKQSQLGAGLFLNAYTETGKFNIDANFGMDKYNYYGIYALTPKSDIDLEQKVNRFKINAFYDHYANEYLNNVRVKSSILSDHFDSKETQAEVLANLSMHDVDVYTDTKMNADLGIGLDLVNSKFGIFDKNESNLFNFNLGPKLTFYKGNSYLTIGSDFSFFNQKHQSLVLEQEKNSKFYWFPKAELQISATDQFKFFGGVEGGLKLNSYNQLLEENPYMISDLYLKPTETKYRLYVGIKGDVDQTLKYNISAGFSKQHDILFFHNNTLIDPTTTEMRKAYDFANSFGAIYDNGTTSEVKASVQFFPLENLVLDGEFHFLKYKLDNLKETYYKPLVQTTFGAKYSMLGKKLNLGFKGIFVTDRTTNSYELTENLATNPTTYDIKENENQKVGGYVDINLSAEYKVHKNFSIFVLGNNLLNTKYQTFYGYKVLGAQVMGGVKITF